MQTRWQSTLEVATDLLCSLGINIGAQLLFYPALATTGRVTLFASLVLALATLRRFVIRRFFEARVSPGRRQPHWQSMVEAATDTVLGWVIAVGLQMLLYGEAATLLRASGLTLSVYGFAIVRRYLLRRVFAAWALRTA